MAKPNFAIDANGNFGQFLVDPNRKIPLAHLESVCNPGKGQATCRYLCRGPKGMVCAKHTSMRPHLDKFALEGTMTARGDNCDGLGEMPAASETENKGGV